MSCSEVPFAFFASLVSAISAIKPRKAASNAPRTPSKSQPSCPASETFGRWRRELERRYAPLPPDTSSTVFRLLFPDADVTRKFGMQETRLAQGIAKVLGVSDERGTRGERLRKWQGEDASGCLGSEVAAVMNASSHIEESVISIHRVDSLLTELAASCAFSAASVRSFTVTTPHGTHRSRAAILTELYSALTPEETAIVTQIILKDLRPILYPIPGDGGHYTAALLQYKSNAVVMLSKEAAMRVWDPSGRMLGAYRQRACMEAAAAAFDEMQQGLQQHTNTPYVKPTVGTPIQIPKCVKGQGCAHSLRTLNGADEVWAETKYDGERAQIHVQLREDGKPKLTIYSKSGRDSTMDRAGVHPILYEALGINSGQTSFKESIVVEAEMVAYSDVLGRIDEFWHIRSLIATTAIGVRHHGLPRQRTETESTDFDTQCSLVSNADDNGTRHLALVFFDILLLDGVSLLPRTYAERRSVLESVIRLRPGRAMLAERTRITMADPETQLRAVFSGHIADHQEGVVLKAGNARYCDWKLPWVKLKRDYIPGHGDTVDLVLFGATWEKERARELRVPPTAYTTFYVGACAVTDKPKASSKIDAIFPVSYGLSREQLEELNFMIKASDIVTTAASLPYSIQLPSGLRSPLVYLRQPLLAEVFGAGFTKSKGNLFYELRFPRMSKVFRASDRPYTDGVTFDEFQRIARESVGRDRHNKDVDDWIKGIFKHPASPGVKCVAKRKANEALWNEKLEAVDRRLSNTTPRKKARVVSRPTERDSPATLPRKSVNMENAASMRDVSPSPLGRKRPMRLGSVTNVTTISGSSGSIQVDMDRLRVGVVSSPEDQLHVSIPPSSSPVARESSRSAVKQLRVSGDQQHLPLPREVQLVPQGTQDRIVPTDLSTVAGHVPAKNFLETSVVWLARRSDSPRPLWRAPSHTIIPLGSRVHTLDALFMGCGWTSQPGCDWAHRGVIFVEDQEGEDRWAECTLNALAERRMAMLKSGNLAGSKPVLVFGMRTLSPEVLQGLRSDADWESRVICRL